MVFGVRAGDDADFAKPADYEFERQFHGVTGVVEDRHGKRVALVPLALVEHCAGQLERRFHIPFDIVLIGPLSADARIPIAVGG